MCFENNKKIQKMGLKKGNTNNPNGRPKGSPNKLTTEMRQLFQLMVEENIELIKQDIKELTPKDRISAFLKISEFVLPKLKTVELNGKFSEEKYLEYVKLKAEHDRLKNMTEEELDEELRKLEKYR